AQRLPDAQRVRPRCALASEPGEHRYHFSQPWRACRTPVLRGLRKDGRLFCNQADGIASMDLFVVPTLSFRLLFGLLILWHGRRRAGAHTDTLAPLSPRM